MKILSLTFFFLILGSGTMAASEPTPSPAVCKTDLKAWSSQNTETLSIAEIDTRMTEMTACAELTKKHEKQMRAYLDEFYRVHGELATRAFDFIMKHDLQGQFGEEEGGTEPQPRLDSRGSI